MKQAFIIAISAVAGLVAARPLRRSVSWLFNSYEGRLDVSFGSGESIQVSVTSSDRPLMETVLTHHAISYRAWGARTERHW